MKNASIQGFCDVLNGAILYSDYKKNLMLNTPYLTRPSIQLTGFFEYFDNDRVQLIGKTENAYLLHLAPLIRESRVRSLFKRDIPCVVLTKGVTETELFIKVAKEEHVILIQSGFNTNESINRTVSYLSSVFAPQINIHGVLVEVLGVGILLTGQSGVGKSEVALDLVHRGHRLVSDDLVQVTSIRGQYLKGSCPELLQYFMEIRGVGIIDVKALFGMGAVKDNVNIDLVVNLTHWEDNVQYERLGTEYDKERILGVEVDKLTVPVKPGRSMAILVETIARNFRINEMGYNAGQVFCDKIEEFNNTHKNNN